MISQGRVSGKLFHKGVTFGNAMRCNALLWPLASSQEVCGPVASSKAFRKLLLRDEPLRAALLFVPFVLVACRFRTPVQNCNINGIIFSVESWGVSSLPHLFTRMF